MQPPHVDVGGIGEGEDVGRSLVELLSSVLIHHVIVVDVDTAIGIHRNHHFSDVGVDLM